MTDATPPALTSLGLKATLPRLRVIEVFRQSALRHLGAEDVYRQLIQLGESVGLSTVYKVLSQFEQVGLLRRSELGQSHTVYELVDADSPRHGHLLCTASGQVTELHLPDLEQRLVELASQHGLQLRHWSLTAWGQPGDAGHCAHSGHAHPR